MTCDSLVVLQPIADHVLELRVVDEESVRLRGKLLEQRLQVVLAQLLLVIQLEDVLELLVRDEAVPVLVNRPDRLHDLDELEVAGYGVDEHVEVIQRLESARVLLYHAVISAEIPRCVLLIEISKVIEAVLNVLVYVCHRLVVLQLENGLQVEHLHVMVL